MVDGVDQMVAAVGRLQEIDSRTCRRSVEERFAVTRMCDDYEALYRRLVG